MSNNRIVNEQYDYMNKMVHFYDRLQDDLSQKIFWARLQYEVTPDMDRTFQLAEVGCNNKIAWREPFEMAAIERKKVILYGASGYGKSIAEKLMRSHTDFYAFCDRDKAGEVVCGKSVLAPQEIIDNPNQYIIIITTYVYHKEIYQFLQEKGFPMASVFDWWVKSETEDFKEIKFREFPKLKLFKAGTAIVDAGCYDGGDTIRYSQWCEGKYSKIYAFEPDKRNYSKCKANIDAVKLPNVTLFQAGLSDSSGERAFVEAADLGSYMVDSSEIEYNLVQKDLEHSLVQVYALDDIADTEVGLIKMNIEGSEFDALLGAKRVIQKDKPQLVICVYHRRGDMLAVMDYLYSLVPEYRFWLRHYGPLEGATVLYAAM